jgi:hypothetical protein
VEVHEYRLMKTQLEHFEKNFPLRSSFKDLEFPALMGKDVITCDNTDFTKEHLNSGNYFPRMGLLYTVPVYNMKGEFYWRSVGNFKNHAFAKNAS